MTNATSVTRKTYNSVKCATNKNFAYSSNRKCKGALKKIATSAIVNDVETVLKQCKNAYARSDKAYVRSDKAYVRACTGAYKCIFYIHETSLVYS